MFWENIPIKTVKCLLLERHHFKFLRREIILQRVQEDEFGGIVFKTD